MYVRELIRCSETASASMIVIGSVSTLGNDFVNNTLQYKFRYATHNLSKIERKVENTNVLTLIYHCLPYYVGKKCGISSIFSSNFIITKNIAKRY